MSLCFSLTRDSVSRNGRRQGFMVLWCEHTLFSSVPTLEFGHSAGARVQGLDLVPGGLKWASGPCVHIVFVSSVAIHGFIIIAKFMFLKNGVRQGEIE